MEVYNDADGDEGAKFRVAYTAANNCRDSGKAMSGKATTTEVRTELEAALKQRYPEGNCWVVDYDEDAGWLVFERYVEDNPEQSGQFRVSYATDEMGGPSLGSDTVAVQQRTIFVPAEVAGTSAPTVAAMATALPMKAAELDPDEMEAWWAGKVPRRLLAIPFSGPIPGPAGKSLDVDAEFFDDRTDIKPSWFEERPVDWHHSKDPTGLLNGVLIGKANRLGTLDGQLGEPDGEGWWVDLWLNAQEKRLTLVRKLAEKGAQLFGSSYAYPNLVRRGRGGHIDVWPYMMQTLSTSPQNTHSVIRPGKAVLDIFDQADIAVRPVLRDVLTELEGQYLPSQAAIQRLRTAGDLPDAAAKAGRELSGRNLAEVSEWLDLLESILSRGRSLRDRVVAQYSTNINDEVIDQ